MFGGTLLIVFRLGSKARMIVKKTDIAIKMLAACHKAAKERLYRETNF
jgi:hypothetical protein